MGASVLLGSEGNSFLWEEKASKRQREGADPQPASAACCCCGAVLIERNRHFAITDAVHIYQAVATCKSLWSRLLFAVGNVCQAAMQLLHGVGWFPSQSAASLPRRPSHRLPGSVAVTALWQLGQKARNPTVFSWWYFLPWAWAQTRDYWFAWHRAAVFPGYFRA